MVLSPSGDRTSSALRTLPTRYHRSTSDGRLNSVCRRRGSSPSGNTVQSKTDRPVRSSRPYDRPVRSSRPSDRPVRSSRSSDRPVRSSNREIDTAGQIEQRSAGERFEHNEAQRRQSRAWRATSARVALPQRLVSPCRSSRTGDCRRWKRRRICGLKRRLCWRLGFWSSRRSLHTAVR